MNYLIDFSLRLSSRSFGTRFHFLKKIERSPEGSGGETERKNLVLLVLVFFPFLMQAQLPMNASQFFAQALEGSDSLGLSEEVKKVRFPWIESYDIRMRTDDFNADENLYTFRISPSTPAKRRAQKALSTHLNAAPDFGAQERFCDQLSDVYQDWLAFYLIHEETKLLFAMDTIIKDRRRVFERMAGAYDFDFKELLKLQTDESDLKIELNELQLEEGRLKSAYRISDQFDLIFNGFIDLEGILILLQADAADSLSLQLAETQYEKELISKELALELAESRQIFDFAQLRYEGPHSNIYRERLSLGVGFRIPNSGNQRLKIQELELKQKALDREQARDAFERKNDLVDLRQKLIRDIQAYYYYQKTIAAERSQLKKLAWQISQKEGFDPLLLLDIEERHLNTRLKAFRMKDDIYSDYLRYMEASGRLCGETERNFLGR